MNKFISHILVLTALGLTLSGCTHGGNLANYTHPESPRYMAFNTLRPDLETNGNVKVVSYNIRHAKKINRAIEILRNNEDLKKADILCLQEMDLSGVEKIADALKYNYVYYPMASHTSDKRDIGNAILTKWPIFNDKKTLLPLTGKNHLQRIAVAANVLVDGREVFVVNVHKETFLPPWERKRQTEMILRSIPDTAEYVIVAGDFNTFSEAGKRAVYTPFEENGFDVVSRTIGWTYKYWYLLNKKSALDHIFAKSLRTQETGKVEDRSASDHFPIWATLQFEKREPSQLAEFRDKEKNSSFLGIF